MHPPFPPIFSLDHFINGFLQPHKSDECSQLFVTGGSYTTPHLTTIDPRIPSPWRSASLLVIMLTLCLTFLMADQYSRIWLGNTKLFLGAVSIGNTFAPLSVVILLSELNLWRNISVLRLGILIAGGGLLALIFTLLMHIFSFSMVGSSLMLDVTAGLIEEPAKVAAAVLLAGRELRNGRILNGMLIGAAIGAGFALFESMGYTFEAMLAAPEEAGGIQFDHALYVMGMRALLSVTAGHVTWSAIACGALWACMQGRRTRYAVRRYPFLLTLLFCILVHGAWNGACFLKLTLPLLPLFVLVTWGALAIVIRNGICRIRDEQRLWYDTYGDTEAIFSVRRDDGSWASPVTAVRIQEMFDSGDVHSLQLCRVGECAIPVPVWLLSFIVDETEELSLWWRLPRCLWYWVACLLGLVQLISLFCFCVVRNPYAFAGFCLSLPGLLILNFCWLAHLWNRLKGCTPHPLSDADGLIEPPRSTAQLWGRMFIPVTHLMWGYRMHVNLVRQFNAAGFVNVNIPLWIPRLYWGSISMGLIFLCTMVFLQQVEAYVWYLLMLLLIFPVLAFFMARVLNCIHYHLKGVERVKP